MEIRLVQPCYTIHCFAEVFPVGFERDLALFVGLIGRKRNVVCIEYPVTIAQTWICIGQCYNGAVCIREQFGRMRGIQCNSDENGEQVFQCNRFSVTSYAFLSIRRRCAAVIRVTAYTGTKENPW